MATTTKPKAPRKRPPTTPSKRGRGRESKLTIASATTIVNAIRDGQYLNVAAEMAHVHPDTLNGWLLIGGQRHWEVQDREPTAHEVACRDFSDAYAHAEAAAEQEIVAAIRRAGLQPSIETTTTTKVNHHVIKGEVVESVDSVTTERVIPPDVRPLQWFAERRFGPRWRQRQAMEISGPEGAPIPVAVNIDKIITGLASLRRIDTEVQASARPALNPVPTAESA